MTPVPHYLFPYILIGTLTIVVAVIFGLQRALKRARWPDRDRRKAVLSVTVLLVGWYLATLLLSWFEFYRGAASRIPTIQYGLISAFPLVMVPVFLVPLSILLHLASLKKLHQTQDERSVSSV